MKNSDLHTKKNEYELNKLQNEAKDLRYAEKTNQVLFEISNAVNTTLDLKELYKSIHEYLKKLLPLPNFYISIVDKEKEKLYFPYCVDEHDGIGEFEVRSFKAQSLTKEVILGKKPLFLTGEALKTREKKGGIAGTTPDAWIGVPLLVSDRVIGVMGIQSYNDPDFFTQKDMDLFVSISNQVAVAIDRKHALEKLKSNEETFRALAENSGDIVMRFDRSYRHLYVSPAIKSVGLTPEDMIGKTYKELGFPEDLVSILEKEIKGVFATKKSGRVEFSIPEGTWFEVLLSPEFSSTDEVVAVITYARDITERKALELQRTSLNRMNQIIINSLNLDDMLDNVLKETQAVFACDRAWIGHFNTKTHEFKLFSEYTLPDWPGALVKNRQVDMSQKSIDKILELAEDGGVAVFNKQAINELNKATIEEYNVKSIIVLPIYVEEDVTWLFGLHHCSKERRWTAADQDFFKQAGQRISDGLSNKFLHSKLKDAKNYINSVINSMPSILIGVNFDFEITGLNSKAEIEAGAKLSEIKGEKLHSVFSYMESHFDKIILAMKDKKVTESRKIPRRINGNLCYENITIYPLIDETVKEAIIRIDDVTDQVRLEEVMIQSEKMLSVGGLAAGMAHEINNPLAGMMQNAQVVKNRLLKDLPANNDAALEAGTSMEAINKYLSKRKIPKMLENINRAGHNAAKIVQNMLSFSHEGVGTRDYNDLSYLIDTTIALAQHDYNLKEKYDFKNIKIVREYDSNLPNVKCKASMIQQVILNILKNGTEAMSEKFDKSENKIKPEFHVRLFKEGKKACIIIKDNGPGMTYDVVKQVFNPFFTTKGPDKGTGLGLSVSYFIIVENHRGEMKVESTFGKGSTFIIKLPIK
jgi:PAS domain S-box-containing protein